MQGGHTIEFSRSAQNRVASAALLVTAVLSMFVFGVLAFTAFAQTRPRFDGLTVESLNVVEKNGQLRAVIANTDRMPDPTGALTGCFTNRQETIRRSTCLLRD